MALPRRHFAAAALAAAALVTMAGCGGAPAPIPTAPPGAVTVTAEHDVFAESSVAAPAGTPFTLFFVNRDAHPHNLRLWDAANSSVATTEVFTGPAARTLDVAALAPGTYRFSCDIHPEMRSQLTVE